MKTSNLKRPVAVMTLAPAVRGGIACVLAENTAAVEEVLKLKNAGVSDETIVTVIQNQGIHYGLSADNMLALHGRGGLGSGPQRPGGQRQPRSPTKPGADGREAEYRDPFGRTKEIGAYGVGGSVIHGVSRDRFVNDGVGVKRMDELLHNQPPE